MTATNEQIISVTNDKFQTWFKNAKIDFGVEGSGVATIDGDKITLTVIENGVETIITDGLYDVDADYYFNVWSSGCYDGAA